MSLFLIPSPIGNLGDFTYRAVETLKKVDAILCEDTRTSSILLKHYEIQKTLIPHHQHNEHRALDHLVEQMLEGKTFALITDAGTPGISDPGFLLLRECLRKGIRVECLPGATAFVPALVQSGIPSNRFCFEGFLPVKKGRQTLMRKLVEEERTIVLYESPHRLLKTLRELTSYLGKERQVSVSRELTKVFEETVRGSLGEVVEHFEKSGVRGELVIVIAGKS